MEEVNRLEKELKQAQVLISRLSSENFMLRQIIIDENIKRNKPAVNLISSHGAFQCLTKV